KDPYATSRDYNLKELEITSIKQSLNQPGKIVDLGCRNGYTLISLDSALKGWEMVGIDFVGNLIEGAKTIREQRKQELVSFPEFICADAIEFIRNCEPDSLSYVITERFIQNLPDEHTQKQMIREIFSVLKSGGRLLMCEGSADGFEKLNE